MSETSGRFFWVSAYAVAMALLEAVVVAYIRRLLYITEDHVSLGPYVRMEIGREAATIVMLAAVGWLAARGASDWHTAFLLLGCGISGTTSGSRCF